MNWAYLGVQEATRRCEMALITQRNAIAEEAAPGYMLEARRTMGTIRHLEEESGAAGLAGWAKSAARRASDRRILHARAELIRAKRAGRVVGYCRAAHALLEAVEARYDLLMAHMNHVGHLMGRVSALAEV